jgi:hypothetical protein
VFDELTGELIRRGRASASFKLTASTVNRFVRRGEA